MSTTSTIIPSAQTKYIRQAILTLSDDNFTTSYVYAGARNVRFSFGNRIIADEILSSDIPVFSTGSFEGTFDAEIIASTDEAKLLAWATPDSTTGELPEINVKIEEKDVEQTTKTWQFNMKITRLEHSKRAEDGTLVWALSGQLTSRPTVS